MIMRKCDIVFLLCLLIVGIFAVNSIRLPQKCSRCVSVVVEVVEVKNDLVTVEYAGNLYAFYGDGFEVSDKATVVFNSEMDIISAHRMEMEE